MSAVSQSDQYPDFGRFNQETSDLLVPNTPLRFPWAMRRMVPFSGPIGPRYESTALDTTSKGVDDGFRDLGWHEPG